MTPAHRIARWLAEYRKGRQYDQTVIHALHVGTEREAELRPDDLEAILAELAVLHDAVRPAGRALGARRRAGSGMNNPSGDS